MKKNLLFCIYLLLALSLSSGCKSRKNNNDNNTPTTDWEQIKQKGELTILTLYSSTGYFLYRGQEMGIQYELGQQLAESLGVNLKVKVGVNSEDLINKLKSGEGDLIAYKLPITKERKEEVLFCDHEFINHQVLVQRKGSNAIKDVTDLLGKTVHVMRGKYYERMINLDQELGGGIIIKEVTADTLNTEDLITQVAKGEIEYTVADNELAQLNRTYYPQLDISLQVSYDQKSAWAVRRDSKELADKVNQWFKENKTSPPYTASMKRYFETSKRTDLHSPILSLEKGIISPFDDYFKKYAKEIEWDWRLLASLAYTESNFDTTVVSWAGAKGLMQLMPRTAKAMGVPSGKEFFAEESIKGAIQYIKYTTASFKRIEKKEEQIKFVLGAYNAGIGHIKDAMALAQKYGKDPHQWENNVEKYILLKSKREYFNDPVCKHGYFRGVETYNFVREITHRYQFYKEKTPN